MNIRTCLTIIVVTILTAKANAGAPLPVPAPAEAVSLRQSIRNQYSDQYAASNDRPSQIALARLLWQASLAPETPAEGYALLCEAGDITARAGDLNTAFRVAQMISDKYAVTQATARAGVLTAAIDGLQGQQEVDSYFKFLTAAIDQALAVDDFNPARQMIEMGDSTIAAQQADFWTQPLRLRQSELQTQQSAFATIKPALDRLGKDRDDADANLIVGRYECLVKGDWKTGLPMLEKGSDEFLQKSARIELAEPRNVLEQRESHWLDGKPQVKVADSWNFLQDIAPEYQLQVRLHSYDWYLRALPLIPETDFETRDRIEVQLQKLLPALDGRRPNAPMFVRIAKAIAHHSTKPTVVIGGKLATTAVQDMPEGGGFLIGFHYGLAKLNGQQVITYLHPIYSTPEGDREGTAFGQLFSKPQTVRANAGYAIGALKIAGDDGLNSITLAFMQIDGDHLNPAKRLNPVRIGGDATNAQIIDSQGEPIVGICGKQSGGFLGLGAVFKVQPVKTVSAK